MISPAHSGKSWLKISVLTTLPALIGSASPSISHGSSSLNRSGATSAEDPARITISPTAVITFPLASDVNGGAYGAPGQTAAIKMPAATIGLGRNNERSITATAGTIM